MANYNDAQKLLQQLKPIINQCIENHPSVKSAIKAKKAIVDSVDLVNKTVMVQFPFDTTPVKLPYNPQMENYLTTGTVKGKTVSVWYYQSISNGIVMQDGEWSETIENGGTINGGININGNISLPTSTITNNFVRTAIITGETSANTRQYAKAHSIEMGVPNRNYMQFNEWGGIFRFYKTNNVYDQESGDGELLAEVDNGNFKISSAFLAADGSNPIYILPYVPYGSIEPNHDTPQYLQNLLKWICENFPDKKNGTWIGSVNPNSVGTAIINIYDTNEVNDEGLPEYSTGTYRNLSNEVVTFTTNSYNFSIRYI